MQSVLFLYFYLFLAVSQKKRLREWTLWHCCLSRKFSGYWRTIGVCGYGNIHGYPWISTENLWIWIWIWMANFISTASLIKTVCCIFGQQFSDKKIFQQFWGRGQPGHLHFLPPATMPVYKPICDGKCKSSYGTAVYMLYWGVYGWCAYSRCTLGDCQSYPNEQRAAACSSSANVQHPCVQWIDWAVLLADC